VGGVTNKVLILISVILNGVLLSFLFGLVPFLLYASIIMNIIFLWYLKNLLREVDSLQDGIMNMFDKLNVFSDHLEKIHAMEMFYGEPVLQDLINHSREIINDIVDMQQDYYDVEEEEVLPDDTEEDSQEEE
jgi:hypothetical protein